MAAKEKEFKVVPHRELGESMKHANHCLPGAVVPVAAAARSILSKYISNTRKAAVAVLISISEDL